MSYGILNATLVSEVKICVVGCGHWGKNLVRNFHSLGHLHSICDTSSTRRETLLAQCPGTKAYADLNDVIGDSEIQAVVLATPAVEHFRMGMAVLRSGKDLFVEKPLALEWQDGQELVETAALGGRVLMVGHLLRYHPAVVKALEIATTGELGKLEYIYSNRLSMGKIRQEENALWSFAPHDISILLALTGQMPLQVSATGGAYLQPNIADVTVSTFVFDRGVRAHIFVSWLHPYKEQRLVIIGSERMLVFEDSRPDRKLLLFDKKIELKNGTLEAHMPQAVPVAFDASEPLHVECSHFADCVLSRKRPTTPGQEGVLVLQVLQACQRSLQMNGQAVQVHDTAALRRVLSL
jgi:predicted dehydrogenase